MARRIRTSVVRQGRATVVQYRTGKPSRLGDLVIPYGSDQRFILWHRNN